MTITHTEDETSIFYFFPTNIAEGATYYNLLHYYQEMMEPTTYSQEKLPKVPAYLENRQGQRELQYTGHQRQPQSVCICSTHGPSTSHDGPSLPYSAPSTAWQPIEIKMEVSHDVHVG